MNADYENWSNFLESQVEFSWKGSEKHTKAHCARVLLYALLIADKMALPAKERDALCAAAVFHDSRRLDDWYDVGHGKRAAAYYRDFCAGGSLPYDPRTATIMAYHDLDDTLGEVALNHLDNGILLYRIFKDADGLDRYRLSPDALDVSMLRTKEGRSLTDFAKRLVSEQSPL
ncbi:HD domain-containing protein [Intestinimonas massiliensis]|uniref:HD domain-containing protein n=1 Tax=Intestinimonas massiliensis (ex Afouda et al. 2020) TaxID=1673721 RepID=A0AAW5JMJ1_9FIRM|nr:HD domain-containing protein [Intestinimonas massiliensis (ex Afouda et al. 2020)]MCQ4770412.1 HD domain-containing protein [Intestinimonas massiliensis (ex Afouda et al. 2020)]